jgi:hypothetical protein
VFDKYICRIIKKEEPTVDDVVEYLNFIILDILYYVLLSVVTCVLIIGPCYFGVYVLSYGFSSNGTEFKDVLFGLASIITFIDVLGVIAIATCYGTDWIYSKIKDKKIAKCPAKK